jgi:glyoxylase-like metal-dependent hydrolase (beta-lactamase superfamily II)
MKKWRFDEIEVWRVEEFQEPLLPPATLFPTISEEILEKHRHWLKPRFQDPQSDLLILSFHSFLICTPQSVILVDTCGGNDKERPQKRRYHKNNYPYLKNLKNAGFEPEDIDFVLCTHLHVDHVGWNTRLQNGNWVPTFPRAQYLFCRDEWDFWNQEYSSKGFTDDPYYKDSLLPIIDSGAAKIISCNYVIDDWVRLSPSPGHTPGHICVELGRGTLNAIMTGDIMHHPIQCSEPQLNSCFCVDPKLSEKTRRALINRFVGELTLIMPAHFPCPSAGRFVALGTETYFEFDN